MQVVLPEGFPFSQLFMKKQNKTSPYPLIHCIIATEGVLRRIRPLMDYLKCEMQYYLMFKYFAVLEESSNFV